MTGLLGYGACYDSLHGADLVVFLGTDLPYVDFLPADNNVQVDLDPARLGRRAPIVQGIAADVALTIRALLPRLGQRTDRTFLDEMRAACAKAIKHGLDIYEHDAGDTSADPPRSISPPWLTTRLPTT